MNRGPEPEFSSKVAKACLESAKVDLAWVSKHPLVFPATPGHGHSWAESEIWDHLQERAFEKAEERVEKYRAILREEFADD